MKTRAWLCLFIILPATGGIFQKSASVLQSQTGERSLQVHRDAINSLPDKPKRWALIIGVDQYGDRQVSPLRGAANDAKILASALVKYAGFPPEQVILLASGEPEDRLPTRVNILQRLSNLNSLVPQDGLLLFAFAGHGMERGGQAFLLPSDARLSNDVNFLRETSLSVTRINEMIKATGVKQVLVMLDACRNDPGGRADAPNPLTESFTRGFNFNSINREVTAFATLYATAVGDRAYEYSEKQQGYFTWAVVEGLKGAAANERGEVTLAGLVKYVQETVPKRIAIDLGSGRRQLPFAVIEGYKADDLVITIVINIPQSDRTGSVDATAVELSFWETIKNSRNPEDFRAYLRKYPNGQFAELARMRAKDKPITAKNTARYVGRDQTSNNPWYWTVFIESDPETISQIECVEYTLHPTFNSPVQRVCTPHNGFAYSARGWGTFEIKVKVIFKDGIEKHLTHHLKFQ